MSSIEIRSLMPSSQDLLCFVFCKTLHSFVSLSISLLCFLCSQSCVPVHTQEHSSTSPTLMTQRSCVDFICWWNRRISLGVGGKAGHISTITAQSHTVCSLCECVCVYFSRHNNLARRLNVTTQLISLWTLQTVRDITRRASSRSTIITSDASNNQKTNRMYLSLFCVWLFYGLTFLLQSTDG